MLCAQRNSDSALCEGPCTRGRGKLVAAWQMAHQSLVTKHMLHAPQPELLRHQLATPTHTAIPTHSLLTLRSSLLLCVHARVVLLRTSNAHTTCFNKSAGTTCTATCTPPTTQTAPIQSTCTLAAGGGSATWSSTTAFCGIVTTEVCLTHKFVLLFGGASTSFMLFL